MRPEAAAAASNLKPASSVPAVRSVSNQAQPDLALHRPRLGSDASPSAMQDGFSGWGVSECGVESRLEAESLTLPASEEMNGWGYRSLQMDALVMTLTPPPEKLNRIWIGGKGAAGEQPSRARMHSLVRTQAKPRFSSSVSPCLTTFVIGAIKLSTHTAPKEGCLQRLAAGVQAMLAM